MKRPFKKKQKSKEGRYEGKTNILIASFYESMANRLSFPAQTKMCVGHRQKEYVCMYKKNVEFANPN